MAHITIPLVTLRPVAGGGFRPRYVPGEKHRRLGLKGQDLKHPDGRWFSLDECAAWSDAQLQRVAELERKTPRQRKAFTRAAGITVAELFARWWKAPRLTGERMIEGRKEREPLSGNTVAFYKGTSRRLEELDGGLIWSSPAAALTADMLSNEDHGVLHRIEVKHGLTVARAVRATGSACWGWGVGRKLVPSNPWKGLDYDMPVPAPRVRYGSIEEMEQLVRAADLLFTSGGRSGAEGRTYHDIGDAIVLGLWTGQRQADRLALIDGQETPDGLLFRQQKKHGQPLLIRKAPKLVARLAAMRLRRADWRVNYQNIVLDEHARRPFDNRHWYAVLFGRVRGAAARGIVRIEAAPFQRVPAKGEKIAAASDWLLKPMPSLADFHDQDLRDTAVTWLALAHCEKAEIASITGHSLKTIDEILKHYLGMHPELARSAIAKLVTWYETQGEQR